MKKFISLFIILLISLSGLEAQKVNKSFTADTVKADTVYFTIGKAIELTKGTISFQFSTTDIADSLSYGRIEGSRDNTNFVALTGNAALSNTSTDGFKEVYLVDNLRFLYYRLALACASGDTVAISNAGILFKEE